MVNLNLFPFDFEDLFADFFHSFPKETKPPIEQFPILDPAKNGEAKVKGWEIQMALAGFKEEEVSVSIEDGLLVIDGDNTKNEEVSSRFRCKFNHKIAYSKQLDVMNAKVSFENGLLRIEIPTIIPKVNRTFLFGK